MRICEICEDEFDECSPLKANAGGKINHCAYCSEETVVPYLGLTSGDGKGSGVTVLAFDSKTAREQYKNAWLSNSGMYKGKSCHLGQSNIPMTGMKFKQRYEAGLGMNHKGQGNN